MESTSITSHCFGFSESNNLRKIAMNMNDKVDSTGDRMTQDDARRENYSRHSRDDRTIQQIILERAVHGATPAQYATFADSKFRPVLWFSNPDLMAIEFSDGSVVYVNNAVGRLATQDKADSAGVVTKLSSALQGELKRIQQEKPQVSGITEEELGQVLANELSLDPSSNTIPVNVIPVGDQWQDYKHIAAWGRYMGSLRSYTEGQMRLAMMERAPIDAIYKQVASDGIAGDGTPGKWRRVIEIADQNLQQTINADAQ